MHHANHFYGHAHIMARYVGLEHPPRIWGYLQHGWNMHDGYAVGTVFTPPYAKFVWSEACARRGWAAGLRDYMVVAAPWLYLLELERQAEWEAAPPPRAGTIVYPFHGWEGQQVLGNHSAVIAEVKAAEGAVPLTFCLYWNEYDDPKVRREYEEAGVRVVTHGQRGYLWQDTDVPFLYRQLREIRRHSRVVSNRMTSAILYGASAGAEVGIYGDPMALESDHAVLGGVGKPRRIFPDMHQFAVPRQLALDTALRELGADEMLLPEEVIAAFGWAAEIERPLPPPPAPPLDEELSVFERRRRRRHRGESRRPPGDAEQPSLMEALVSPTEDEAPEVEEVESSSTVKERAQKPEAATPTGGAEETASSAEAHPATG